MSMITCSFCFEFEKLELLELLELLEAHQSPDLSKLVTTPYIL
jgi:hypothetical protein